MANVLYGLDSLAAALAAESFPTDKGGLFYSVGDLVLEDHDGRVITLRDVLGRLPDTTFDEPLDALNAILQAVGQEPVEQAYLERVGTIQPAATRDGDHQAAIEGDDQLIDSMERIP